MTDELNHDQTLDTASQTNQAFNDPAHQQGQGQTQSGVPGAEQTPLNPDHDTGTEALTGNGPQPDGDADLTDNADTDNFATAEEDQVEDVDSDPQISPVGSTDARQTEIDRAAGDDNDADEDMMPAV